MENIFIYHKVFNETNAPLTNLAAHSFVSAIVLKETLVHHLEAEQFLS